MGSLQHVHVQWVTPSPVPGGAIGQSLEGGILLNIRKVVHEAGPRKERTKFCYKMKSCPTPCVVSVLHAHAQWVTQSPVPGGAIAQCLEGGSPLNIRNVVHEAGPRK